jgi:sugar lactone lactonase YvrE
VFTSVPSDNAVRWTDSAGTERLRWGGAGSDTASLNGPSGIASAPDGSVYVVDRANHRILHYRLPQ